MQPFAKNMAVEYAAKALPDSELKQALDTLQQAIDGKIGFDGEIKITYAGNPELRGYSTYQGRKIFKTTIDSYLKGIVILTRQQRYDAVVLCTYNGNLYTGSANYDTDSMTLIKAVTKLYLHTFRLDISYKYDGNIIENNTFQGYRVISTKQGAFNISEFVYYFRAWFGDTNGSSNDNVINVSTSYLRNINGSGGSANCKPTENFSRNYQVKLYNTYPGDTNFKIEVNAPDTIDLTTGEVNDRTNLATELSITNFIDSVSPI